MSGAERDYAERTRIVICDDHPVVRDGVRSMLSFEPDLEVVGEASNGEEAVAKAARLAPDVVLMDLEMPVMDGYDAIARIRQLRPQTRVLVVSGHDSAADLSSALRRGASGYIVKDSAPREFFGAIRDVAAGGSGLSPKAQGFLLGQFQERPGELTGEELEVLRRVAYGKANKEIAEDLGKSKSAVGRNLEQIFEKLQAKDRAHAVAIAMSRDMIRFE